jgi:hypothetical protein
MARQRGGSGGLSRRTALLLIGGGGLVAISGSGAFETVNAGRGFSVNSASDENALLGIKTFDPTYTQKNKPKKILELLNQTQSSFTDISVSVSSSHTFLTITETPDRLEPTDGWIPVEAETTAEPTDTSPVELTITAESDATTITATRLIGAATNLGYPPACPVPTGVGARGPQDGDPNVDLNNTEIDGDVSAEKGSVDLHKVKINGNISAGENVTISGANNDSYVVCGSIEAGGKVTIRNHMETGPITSGGDVIIKPNSTVYGDIDADGVVKKQGVVKGDIKQGGSSTQNSNNNNNNSDNDKGNGQGNGNGNGNGN